MCCGSGPSLNDSLDIPCRSHSSSLYEGPVGRNGYVLDPLDLSHDVPQEELAPHIILEARLFHDAPHPLVEDVEWILLGVVHGLALTRCHFFSYNH